MIVVTGAGTILLALARYSRLPARDYEAGELPLFIGNALAPAVNKKVSPSSWARVSRPGPCSDRRSHAPHPGRPSVASFGVAAEGLGAAPRARLGVIVSRRRAEEK